MQTRRQTRKLTAIALSGLALIVLLFWAGAFDPESDSTTATVNTEVHPAVRKVLDDLDPVRGIREPLVAEIVERTLFSITGTISGTLMDTEGSVVGGGFVYITDTVNRHTQEVSEDGTFTFEYVPPGEWLVLVDPPNGYLPPYSQKDKAYIDTLPASHRNPLVNLQAGETETCKVVVFSPATVDGRVINNLGHGVSNVWVQLRYHASNMRTDYVAKTDDLGMFSVGGIYPGWMFAEISGFEEGHPLKEFTRPDAVDFQVFERSQLHVELLLTLGDLEIAGTVVNGWTGDPLPNHRVRAWYYKDAQGLQEGESPSNLSDVAFETRTDERGSYTLLVFSDRRAKISFSVDHPVNQAGERMMAGWVDDMEYDPRQRRIGQLQQKIPQWLLDYRAGHITERPPGAANWETVWRNETSVTGSMVIAPTITVWPSRSYVLHGSVSILSGLTPRDIVVTVTQPDSWELPPEFDSLHIGTFEEKELDVQDDGTFVWECETPHAPVVFVISVKGEGTRKFDILPDPWLSEDISFW